MKIAFFHELRLGGALRTADEYSKRLKEKHKVDLYVVSQKNQKIDPGNFHDIFSYHFHSKEWSQGDWKTRLYKDTIELLQLNFLHKKIARAIDKKNYDFVFVHPSQYTQAPFLLKYLHVPTIYYCQEPLRIAHDEYVNRVDNLPLSRMIYELLNRWVRKRIDLTNVNHAQVILANSRFSQERIQKAYKRTSYLCYLGVDTSKFKSLNKKRAYDILFVGEEENIEGYDLLVSAISYFKKKPTVKVISRRSDGKGISDENLIAEYNKAKIVVALSRNEPFGLLPLEAMSCGRPIIAVNEGGFLESIIDGKTGFLIERDAKKLYEAIDKLLSNERLQRIISKEAREHVVKNWTWDKSVSKLYNIIRQCIPQK